MFESMTRRAKRSVVSQALAAAAFCLAAECLPSSASAQNTLIPQVSAATETQQQTAGELGGKWLSNASCVKCHFHVPQDGTTEQLSLSLLKKGYLSTAGYRDAVQRHLKGQQCAECHVAAADPHGECARGFACWRDAGNQKKVAYLGVSVGPVPAAVRQHVKLPAGVGLIVESVEPDGPAAKAELRTYDILEKLDRQLLVNQEQFSVLIKMHRPGEEVTLELIRANEPKTSSITLGERLVDDGRASVTALAVDALAQVSQDDTVKQTQVLRAYDLALQSVHNAPHGASANQVTYLGVSTSPPPDALVEQLKFPKGLYLVVDAVEADSPVAAAGLRRFDVLQQLDDQLLVNAEQLSVLVRNRRAGEEVELTLIREGQPLKIRVKLGERQVGGNATESATGAVLRDFDNDGRLDLEVTRLDAMLSDVVKLSLERDSVSDEEYARRVYLDLTGTLPVQGELADFIADERPNKRQRLIDRLLSRPDVLDKIRDSAVLEWSDSEHSLVLTTSDAGEKRLVAKGKEGNLLFDGPVETDAERQQLGPRLVAKLELMLKGMAAPAVTAPADADAALDKLLTGFQADEETLAQLLDRLRRESGANIVVDRKALAAAGVKLDGPLSLDLHDVRARTVLKTLLALAAGPGARLTHVVDDGVILITISR
ncbi:MAG TPA: PDZ domain-containing protein [Pirellulales bacterium]|nr:PDZ domain-containing protein [Pirellulales bacterium]